MRRFFGSMDQAEMYLATLLGAVGAFVAGLYALQDSGPYVLAAWMLVLSTIAMKVLRWFYENDQPPLLLGSGKRSQAFMWGDTLALPAGFVFAGHGWQQATVDWKTSYGLALVCLAVVGTIVAAGFRAVDSRRYIDAGHAAMLLSPTKVWHDCAVMPVASAMMAWLLLPQLLGDWTSSAWWALACLAGFALLCVSDMINPPDPTDQHVPWDARQFQPL